MIKAKLKTIQITIDEQLLGELDRDAEATGEARSAWIRRAVRTRLNDARMAELDRLDRAGYEASPQAAAELDEVRAYREARAWGDEWED